MSPLRPFSHWLACVGWWLALTLLCLPVAAVLFGLATALRVLAYRARGWVTTAEIRLLCARAMYRAASRRTHKH